MKYLVVSSGAVADYNQLSLSAHPLTTVAAKKRVNNGYYIFIVCTEPENKKHQSNIQVAMLALNI